MLKLEPYPQKVLFLEGAFLFLVTQEKTVWRWEGLFCCDKITHSNVGAAAEGLVEVGDVLWPLRSHANCTEKVDKFGEREGETKS